MVVYAKIQPSLFGFESDKSGFSAFCSAINMEAGLPWADQFGAALRKWAVSAISKPIRTLSLFSGAGGLDIAFHDAGFQIEKMVEIEEKFAATLLENCGKNKYFGQAQVVCEDIRSFIPPKDLNIDFIIGGPPCQSFSAAGRRAAGVQGTDDHRGMLFSEYVRLLQHFNPVGFLFENVYGITGAQQGKAWKNIQDAFSNVGYVVSSYLLDAADYGVPQHRERMFIVGAKSSGFRFPRPTHGPDSPEKLSYTTAEDAVTDAEITALEKSMKVKGRFGHLLEEVPAGLNYSYFTEKMNHPNPIFSWRSKFSDFLYKSDPNTPVRTIKAQGGQYTGPFHWDARPFSISELKRLQTFPDSYQIVGRKQVAIQQIGNSVPPQIGRILAISILNQLFGVSLPSKIPLLETGELLGFRQRKRSLTAIYKSKAKAVLEKKTFAPKVTLESHSYLSRLGKNFSLDVVPSNQANSKVTFTCIDNTWRITSDPINEILSEGFSIKVIPDQKTKWVLDVSSVFLESACVDSVSFTTVWKAFEAELVRHSVKADLVQLFGYYQYKPTIRCEMVFHDQPNDPKWYALKKVVSRIGVGSIFHVTELADIWELRESAVLDFAHWLKKLGYEARSSWTNPQIPKQALLIPYAFPTLNPMSVQLRKVLAGDKYDQ